jgi:hypothetical protein
MATKTAKAPEAGADSRKPAFVLRARQTQTAEQIRRREQPFYTQVGAMWRAEWKDRETGEMVEGFSVKVNQAPIGWDGDCVAVPYRERPQKEA